LRDGADFVERIQVALLARAEQQGGGAAHARVQRVAQHRQHRRQAAATGDEQQRRIGRAQPEVAQRAVDGDFSPITLRSLTSVDKAPPATLRMKNCTCASGCTGVAKE
jgi:hypothetical protein